jgi:hypothetical protein
LIILENFIKFTTTQAVTGMSPRQGVFSSYGWRNGLQIWKVAANVNEKAVADRQKGVVLQLEGWARC